MISEHQQELATRYALGELDPIEADEFASQVRANAELRSFLVSVQKTFDLAAASVPAVAPPAALKERVLGRIRAGTASGKPAAKSIPEIVPAGLKFLAGSDTGWKPLPVLGAFIKLLSLQADRGYAVLLGKLDPGVRYPAHVNAGPEDFYILTGDLHVGDRVLRAGDFHHAEKGSHHAENYSVEGCTLLAVLTTDDPLVQFAMV
jgi:anti-sigma factor ChrR (cupin superfamily)